ncbi:hypothetical protein HO440_09800 [Streptococcus suis]|nr:hypothetical protein [Streptococcus suis]
MQEKLKMIADHEEKYGQIGDEVRELLLQQKHHIIQKNWMSGVVGLKLAERWCFDV